jgi:hypothetical protein
MRTSRNKVAGFLVVISLLLLVDYSLKVMEFNNLVANVSRFNQIDNENIASFEKDYVPNIIKSSWTDSQVAGLQRYVAKSSEDSVSAYVLITEIKRTRIMPWHQDLTFAKEDLLGVVTQEYEFYDSVKMGDEEGVPTVLWMENYGGTEKRTLFSASWEKAKPFPNLFLDSIQYE